jgi:hypothetical protein
MLRPAKLVERQQHFVAQRGCNLRSVRGTESSAPSSAIEGWSTATGNTRRTALGRASNQSASMLLIAPTGALRTAAGGPPPPLSPHPTNAPSLSGQSTTSDHGLMPGGVERAEETTRRLHRARAAGELPATAIDGPAPGSDDRNRVGAQAIGDFCPPKTQSALNARPTPSGR